MADGISIRCPHCGRQFSVSEDLAGLAATCPQCEHQVSVPFPPDVAEQRPRLQIKRGTPVAGGKACPSCGAGMAEDAVICVRCGFDTRTGVSWQAAPAKSKAVRVILAIGGVVLALGWLRWWLKSKRESGPLGDVPVVAASTSMAVQSASAESPAPLIVQESTSSAPAVVETSAPVETGEVENVVRKPSGPSRAELEMQFTQALNARYPLYSRGMQAVLRQNNGLVYRGEVLVLGTNSVTVKTELGIKEIPFSALDRDSRLRCDREARRRLVALRVDQVMAKAAAK